MASPISPPSFEADLLPQYRDQLLSDRLGIEPTIRNWNVAFTNWSHRVRTVRFLTVFKSKGDFWASTLRRVLQDYPAMTPHTPGQSVSQLLSALKPDAFERVAKSLRRVKLRPKEVVYKPNEPIEHILFPENAVVCLMTVMSNGDTIEAATVGREGATWISASVGAPSMPCETIVVIEGTALRLPIADLDRELKNNGHFRDVLTEYSHALLVAAMRTSACNGLHGLQERCARWILMTLDRVDSDRFTVTKEFLAQLLGTNRPTVSVMVSALEKAGILNVKGREVTLANRDRLKEAACECYDIIRKTYESVGS